MICQDTSLPNKVAENTMRFRNKMTKLGFTISVSIIIFLFQFWFIGNLFQFKGDNHAISPVMLGDAKLASQFAELMLSKITKIINYKK